MSGVEMCRRFLHTCYSCGDCAAAERFLTDGLGLQVTMRTSGGGFDGSVLGMDGTVDANVAFAFDGRGPRTSPALEVQGWVDPPVHGQPYDDATAVGIQAIGIGVPSLGDAVRRAEGRGAHTVGPRDTSVLLGGVATIVRDPTGIRFDLVEGTAAPQLVHLRVTCSDIDRSVAWYEGLGFEVLERKEHLTVPGALFGRRGDATIHVARLRLPDEATALVLTEWVDPPSAGQPYDRPNHAGLYRVALGVDDARDAARTLEAAGVPIERRPRVVDLAGTNVPSMWIAFLLDPDGIPVELVERPRSAFR